MGESGLKDESKFWLRQLVKFIKMEKTERGIDFVGSMGR